jgi:hypothetical protein
MVPPAGIEKVRSRQGRKNPSTQGVPRLFRGGQDAFSGDYSALARPVRIHFT